MATTRGIDTGIPMTAKELERLLRGRARFELIQGQLRVIEPGGFEHGQACNEAAFLLRTCACYRVDDVVDCSDVVPGFAPRVSELLGLDRQAGSSTTTGMRRSVRDA